MRANPAAPVQSTAAVLCDRVASQGVGTHVGRHYNGITPLGNE